MKRLKTGSFIVTEKELKLIKRACDLAAEHLQNKRDNNPRALPVDRDNWKTQMQEFTDLYWKIHKYKSME